MRPGACGTLPQPVWSGIQVLGRWRQWQPQSFVSFQPGRPAWPDRRCSGRPEGWRFSTSHNSDRAQFVHCCRSQTASCWAHTSTAMAWQVRNPWAWAGVPAGLSAGCSPAESGPQHGPGSAQNVQQLRQSGSCNLNFSRDQYSALLVHERDVVVFFCPVDAAKNCRQVTSPSPVIHHWRGPLRHGTAAT